MQNIHIYLRVNDSNALLVDQYNQPLSSNYIPTLTRGIKCNLVLHLLSNIGENLTSDQLSNLVAFDFVLASDFLTSTVPQIRVQSGINVLDNVITIPLANTNTIELIEYLGNSETKTIGAELAAFEQGQTTPSFLIQFSINVKNRRSEAGTGTPTVVDDGSLNASQTYALLRSKPSFQFSQNGVDNWHDVQDIENDLFFRFNYLDGAWSDAIELLIGTQGIQGIKGDQGDKGDKGDQGTQGIQGIPGPTGAAAPLALYEYSINGESWHDDIRSTDIYERISNDLGATWTGARRFRGDKGDKGDIGPTGATGAGFDSFPQGSATYLLYVSNQTATAFEMGEDGEVLTSRNGFPVWEPVQTTSTETLAFNTFSAYEQQSNMLASGSFTGGANGTPVANIDITEPTNNFNTFEA